MTIYTEHGNYKCIYDSRHRLVNNLTSNQQSNEIKEKIWFKFLYNIDSCDHVSQPQIKKKFSMILTIWKCGSSWLNTLQKN